MKQKKAASKDNLNLFLLSCSMIVDTIMCSFLDGKVFYSSYSVGSGGRV